MFLIVFPFFSFGGLPQLLVQICKILSESDPVFGTFGGTFKVEWKEWRGRASCLLEEL